MLSLAQAVLLGIFFTTLKLFTPTTTWLSLLMSTIVWSFLAYRTEIEWSIIFSELGRALRSIHIVFVGIILWLTFLPLGTWTALKLGVLWPSHVYCAGGEHPRINH